MRQMKLPDRFDQKWHPEMDGMAAGWMLRTSEESTRPIVTEHLHLYQSTGRWPRLLRPVEGYWLAERLRYALALAAVLRRWPGFADTPPEQREPILEWLLVAAWMKDGAARRIDREELWRLRNLQPSIDPEMF